MRFIFVLALLVSTTALAGQQTFVGKIFLGGFTFSKENYLPTSIQIESAGGEIQVILNPLEPFNKCIKEFGIGTYEYSQKLWISGNTLIRYKIPVTVSCSKNGSKLFKLDIVYFGDTDEIKSVRLSPYRRKSAAYFSTDF